MVEVTPGRVRKHAAEIQSFVESVDAIARGWYSFETMPMERYLQMQEAFDEARASLENLGELMIILGKVKVRQEEQRKVSLRQEAQRKVSP